MKKIIVLLLIVFLFTGCNIDRIDNDELDQLIDKELNQDLKLSNSIARGYSYYKPKGVKRVNINDNNIVFQDDFNNKYYLYTDIIYAYKNVKVDIDKCEDCFYSKIIDLTNKDEENINYSKYGYVEIHQYDDKYFVEMVFNYAKIESYVSKSSLKSSIMNMGIILRSIRYNNTVINSLVGDSSFNYTEETFDNLKPKRKNGNFIDYIEIYDNYDENVVRKKDEEIIDVGEE